jgi:hypothetical protein
MTVMDEVINKRTKHMNITFFFSFIYLIKEKKTSYKELISCKFRFLFSSN